ncbi:MAG: efflux transporter outer membrane subunit [Oligoflexia bacterium]|nr:efflux transporter outer membrane subunit [Oligoflexia bacterium]
MAIDTLISALNRKRLSLVSCFALFGLTACAVGPSYERPEVATPADWSAPEGNTFSNETPANLSRWWTVFSDPVLNSLVEKALRSNHDLRIAVSRVSEVRARYGISFSALWPSIGAAGAYERTKLSENLGGRTAGATSQGQAFNSYQAGFDAAWEIDVFGGTRREIEAAWSEFEASQAQFAGTLVSLLAELGHNYLELRGLQHELKIANKNIGAQEQVLKITKARFDAGLVSELDVTQAEAQLASTRAAIPDKEAAIKSSIFRIAFLTAQPIELVLPELIADAPAPKLPTSIPVGLPSELLRRRPDIIAAERSLEAATANVGVAISDWFPKFSLTGSFGVSSEKSGSLFDGNSSAWSFGPRVQWPIFDAGRIRANIRVQNARAEQALAGYERAVQSAFADVETALTSFEKQQERYQALSQAVDATQRSYALAQELYTKGLTDFVRVLEAERSLFQAEDQLSQSGRVLLTNLVAVYKALGGGWTEEQSA